MPLGFVVGHLGMGRAPLWTTVNMSEISGGVGCVRNLTQDDLELLIQSGVELGVPLQRPTFMRDSSIPVFDALTSRQEAAHVHFAWLGSGTQADAQREHWQNMIETVGAHTPHIGVQQIRQSVDLEDLCALAVTPARSLVEHLAEAQDPVIEVTLKIRELCTVILRLATAGIHPLELDERHVLIGEHGQLELSAMADLSFGQVQEHGSYPSGFQLVSNYLDCIGQHLSTLTHQLTVLRGILNAVAEQPDGRTGLGDFVLALSAHIEMPRPTESTSAESRPSGTWSRQLALETQRKRSESRRKTGVAVAISLVCAAIIPLAANAVASSGNPESPRQSEFTSTVQSHEMLVQQPEEGRVAEQNVAESSKVQSTPLDVLTIEEMLTERLATIAVASGTDEPVDLSHLYILGSEAEREEQSRIQHLRDSGITITGSELTVTEAEMHPASGDNDSIRTIVVSYDMSYAIATAERNEQLTETERTTLELHATDSGWRINSATPAPDMD